MEIVFCTTSMEKSIAHASPFGENPAGEIAHLAAKMGPLSSKSYSLTTLGEKKRIIRGK